jgi:hypothetical protein
LVANQVIVQQWMMADGLVLDAVIVRVILKAAIYHVSISKILRVFERIHIHAFRNITILNQLSITSTSVVYKVLLLSFYAVSTIVSNSTHRLT